ncbi:hypothetical protein SLS56_002372 [Neofusicoccum ribis]|uniref:CAIB/BAIF family enzyme n=1 Tax=Neofusicoccum ribis TaxID=45134 RepID=A0ABR3T4E6_9PEZI
MDYCVQDESRRILRECILSDETLQIPQSISNAAESVTFIGDDVRPFLPSPSKMTESASALSALVAAAASAIAADRYGIEYQKVKINTDLASVSLFSVILPTVDGAPFMENKKLREEIAKGNLYEVDKPIRAQSTNLYHTKDGKWYYLHGSLNPSVTMQMLGIEDTGEAVTHEEAVEVYKAKVAQWASSAIEETANLEYRQPGVVCHTHEEFLVSEQTKGKVMSKEPLYTLRALPAPRSEWPPAAPRSVDFKPLAGIRVVDFSRVIAAPVVSKILAVLGAEVVKVSWSGLPDHGFLWVDLSAGKRDADINLKSDEGKEAFSALLKGADVLIDGYRPGVLQRLGFAPQVLRKINPSLVIPRISKRSSDTETTVFRLAITTAYKCFFRKRTPQCRTLDRIYFSVQSIFGK